MTERVKKQLDILKKREYRKERKNVDADVTDMIRGKTEAQIEAIRFSYMLELEEQEPRIFEGDRIGFNRTIINYPCYKNENGEVIMGGTPGNITPDYGKFLKMGMDEILGIIENYIEKNGETDVAKAMKSTVISALRFADKYRDFAKEKGCVELYRALCNVPHKGASSFYEACVFMKFIIFTLRCNRNNHITLGRFDQYMYPFFIKDREAGKTEEELLELTEEFFISINFDTDLYFGVQQGDNGQSLVLGGIDENGNDMFNDLSRIIMKASLELKLIDPKINLRVNKNTPFELYLVATELTAQGLGFPQYSNDDVVIEGLKKLGYEPKDAADYAVAACWEFIVPGCAMDIPNIITMNFPKVVREAITENLLSCGTYGDLWKKVEESIERECLRLREWANNFKLESSPYLAVFITGCLETCTDIWQHKAKYNNYGCHGAGISNAADSLAAVKLLVYEKREISPDLLIEALENDFNGFEELRHKLLQCPKMGNNDDYVDSIASDLMDVFSKNMNNKPNSCGGIFRAGTGSAMEYIWSAQTTKATPDGRKAFAPYGSSFSPSLTAHTSGILSVIQSFTKFNMQNIINGGPLTVELHSSVFRNREGIEKTAMLVREFIRRGGHQIQLNSINREILLDAKKHPENHADLIVRVWGWSGYFNELAPEYQEHIIKRTEFTV